ncbi:MAG: hypothetical protein ACOX0T_11185 [Pelotomaculum sp.]
MQIKLTDEEKATILNALNIARIFYEKTKRKEDYFKVDNLSELLLFEKEITVDLSDSDIIYKSEQSKRLETLLKEREAQSKAPKESGQVYQFKSMPDGPVDPDDPDDVAADKYLRVKMKKMEKEHPEI